MMFILFVIAFTPMQVRGGENGAMTRGGVSWGGSNCRALTARPHGLDRSRSWRRLSWRHRCQNRTNGAHTLDTHASISQSLTHMHTREHSPRRGCDPDAIPWCFNYWGIFIMDIIVDLFFTADIFVNFRSAWIDMGHMCTHSLNRTRSHLHTLIFTPHHSYCHHKHKYR